jgi:hypothetical protein
VSLFRQRNQHSNFLAGYRKSRSRLRLSPDDVTSAANQFHRYGILEEMELPGPVDDRISEVIFECDLAALVEKMR